MWYDVKGLLSHNCFINIVIGNRGGGKSFSSKKWAIDDYLKKGNEFIYVRRYKSELKKLNNYFSDIKHLYPNLKLEVKGSKFYCDDKVFGYAIPLSTSLIEKSTSYPLVTKIIFDEFIISTETKTHRYLNNEVEIFLDLIETVQRMSDRVKILMVANAISMINPYFIEWKITHLKGRFNKFMDKLICVELYKNQEFIDMKKQTNYGRLILNTKYGKYSMENEFKDDNYEFIEKIPNGSYYYFGIKYKNNIIGVWSNSNTGCIYLSNKYDKARNNTIVLTKDDLEPNMLLLTNSDKNYHLSLIKRAFKFGYVRFESLKIKSIGYDILSLLNIK